MSKSRKEGEEMLEILKSKKIAIASGIFTVVMFIVVVFIVNPMIDEKDGTDVLSLQLAFDKDVGVSIVENWTEVGLSNFKHLFFTDYLYALGYSIFFASLLSILIFKANKEHDIKYIWVVYLSFFAGFCDWLENTIELFFVNNMEGFSSGLFFSHSVIATLKWLSVPIAFGYIFVLLYKVMYHNERKE